MDNGNILAFLRWRFLFSSSICLYIFLFVYVCVYYTCEVSQSNVYDDVSLTFTSNLKATSVQFQLQSETKRIKLPLIIQFRC